MSTTRSPEGTWYGEFTVPQGETRFWRIGPTELWLTRQVREWRLSARCGTDRLDARIEAAAPGSEPADAGIPDAGFTTGPLRMGFSATEPRLVLTPRVADRPFVVRPDHPFLVPPGEELTLFVSTILWLTATVDPGGREIVDMPLYRPSDTWFGSTPLEGEICYDLETSARLQRENLPIRPHRAVSALTVRNRAAGNLVVEKLLLPMTRMSVYADAGGDLWTQTATYVHTGGGRPSPLVVSSGPPVQAGDVRLLSGPRASAPRHLLPRAFSELLGEGF